MLLRKSLCDFLPRKIPNKSVYTIKKALFFSKSSTQSGEQLINMQNKYLTHIYDPIPVVLCRGQGSMLWDVDGKCYLDFMSAYASLNTGHCHEKILNSLRVQAGTIHHTSRAIYNNVLPQFGEYISQMFNYEKVIPMNTGVEGGETAIKIARKWGYCRKNIPENQALIIMAEQNFWGRTLSAVSTSTNPEMYQGFGPYMPGFAIIPFNNICALEEALCNANVCAFMVEPIQGEAGVIVPSENYLREVRRVCTERNVLWIADEVQTGLGRTGELLACDHECVRPDLLILGKGLAGGIVPMSAVLGTEEAMHVMTPGTHGSTYGGNPLACALAMTTLDVIKEEELVQNAKNLGTKFRCQLQCRLPKDIVPIIRGKGLLNAIVFNKAFGKAQDISMKLKNAGLLAKYCNDHTIIFTPPLVINETELMQGVQIITDVVHELKPV